MSQCDKIFINNTKLNIKEVNVKCPLYIGIIIYTLESLWIIKKTKTKTRSYIEMLQITGYKFNGIKK